MAALKGEKEELKSSEEVMLDESFSLLSACRLCALSPCEVSNEITV